MEEINIYKYHIKTASSLKCLDLQLQDKLNMHVLSNFIVSLGLLQVWQKEIYNYIAKKVLRATKCLTSNSLKPWNSKNSFQRITHR